MNRPPPRPGRRRQRGLAPVAAPLARVARGLGAAPGYGRLQVAWALAAGDRLGQRTRVRGLDGTCLSVAVPDEAWAAQLGALQGTFLGRLARTLGPGVVRRLRFDVVPGEVRVPDAPATPRPRAVTDADRREVADAGVTNPDLAEAIARAMAASRGR